MLENKQQFLVWQVSPVLNKHIITPNFWTMHFALTYTCVLFTLILYSWSEGHLWLNATKLKSIWREDTFSSLTVATTVEHKLTLQYGVMVRKWIFSIFPGKYRFSSLPLIVKTLSKFKHCPVSIDLNKLCNILVLGFWDYHWPSLDHATV